MWLITSILETLKAMFNFGAEVIPPDEVQIKKQSIQEERKRVEERDKIIEVVFDEFKNNDAATDDDIRPYISYVVSNNALLDFTDVDGLLRVVNVKILKHRQGRPIRFKRWLREHK